MGGGLSGGLRGGELHRRGVFLIRMLVSSSSQSFFMTTSVGFGLCLTALLGYPFFFFSRRKTCLFCRVVFFKVA